MKKINQFIKQYGYYLLLLIPFFFIDKCLDNDIWFMLNHGRYIINNGFVSIEPFTLHQGLEFSFEKWLTCVIFYKLYETFGSFSIIAFVFLFAILLEYLVYYATKTISNNKIINILSTSITCSLLFMPYLRSRPQIFSYALLIIEFILLEKYIQAQEKYYLFWLPIISLLYMQLHSTMWPMFFIMIMPYLCDSSKLARGLKLKECDYAKKPIITATIISFVAGFINPYGYKSVIYLIKSLRVTNMPILEVAAPDIFGVFNFLSVIIFMHIIYWLVKSLKPQNKLNTLPLRYLYILLGTFALFGIAVRNGAFYIIYAGIITAYMFEQIDLDKNVVQMSFLAIFVAVFATFIFASNNTSLYMRTKSYTALNELKLDVGTRETKIYTDFNSGGYAEFLGFKAYIDPRAEVFIEEINGKENIFEEYQKIASGKIHYEDLQQKYDFDYWLVQNNTVLDTYMKKDENYNIVIETKDYNIYQPSKNPSAVTSCGLKENACNCK